MYLRIGLSAELKTVAQNLSCIEKLYQTESTESSFRVLYYAIFVETFEKLAQAINTISYNKNFFNDTVIQKERNGIDEEELIDKSFHMLDRFDNIKSITKIKCPRLYGKIKFLGKLCIIVNLIRVKFTY